MGDGGGEGNSCVLLLTKNDIKSNRRWDSGESADRKIHKDNPLHFEMLKVTTGKSIHPMIGTEDL